MTKFEEHNQQCIQNATDIAVIKEKLKESKEDKDKATAWTMRLAGIFATVVLSVAASAINSYSTINVLEEKVMEQKNEINKLNIYIQDVEDNLEYRLNEHQH